MIHAKWSETGDRKEWNDFVAHNGGTIFHTWAWEKVLENDQRKPAYLVCRNEDGRILAVCPFMSTLSRRFRYLDSLPRSFIAGPVIAKEATDTEKIIRSLLRSVKPSPLHFPHLVREIYVKVHREELVKPMIALGFPYKIEYGLFITDLEEKPPEHIWNSGFQKHDRQAVKYYEQRGAVFRFAAQESDYDDYLALGEGATFHPYHGPDFFSKMRLGLGDKLKVALVAIDGKVTAGAMLICDPDASTVHMATMRYSTVKNIHSPVTHINWRVVDWAAQHRFRYVDFGLWLADHVSDPSHFAYKMKSRFEATFFPIHEFTLRPSGIIYSMARRVNRLMLRVRRVKERGNPGLAPTTRLSSRYLPSQIA